MLQNTVEPHFLIKWTETISTLGNVTLHSVGSKATTELCNKVFFYFQPKQESEQQCGEWTPAHPPPADVCSFKAGALEMPISSAAQRRSFPFSVLLLSSSIVSLWGSLFRGIHASAFRPQWLPLYKLSAYLPEVFGSYCFLFLNNLGGVHQLLQQQIQAQNNRQAVWAFFPLVSVSEGPSKSTHACLLSVAAWLGLKIFHSADVETGICVKVRFLDPNLLIFSVIIPAKITWSR